MAFSLKTEYATPKTHGRRFSCGSKNAYRLLQVENPGLRFYSANLARWISRDPVAEYGGLNILAFVGNEPFSSSDSIGLTECTVKNVGEIDLNTVTLTTGLISGKGITLKDPKSYFFEYFKDSAIEEVKAAGEAKSKWLKYLSSGLDSAKSFLQKVGMVGEAVADLGALVETITFDTSFSCCKCTVKDKYEWVPVTTSTSLGDKEPLLISLKVPSELKKLPDLYITVMVNAAEAVVAKCPKKK